MTFAPIQIVHLFAYAGPNIFGPQPGVLLRVACNKDYSRRIADALKDGAQFIGLILAYLKVTTAPQDGGFVISASFTTPNPAIGTDLAAYVVEGIAARERGDTEWDKDTPLFELQKRRRREAAPVSALQLVAEARQRGLPVLHLSDGRVQFGYGAHGWSFDPAALAAAPATPPWERLGDIPLYIVTGEHGRAAMVERAAARLQAAGQPVWARDDADYAATAALLADPTVSCAVIGLRSADILRRGIAFDRCSQAIITDLNGVRPPEANDDDEWVRAVGVPMLVAAEPVRLNSAEPALATLVAYAPNGILPLE